MGRMTNAKKKQLEKEAKKKAEIAKQKAELQRKNAAQKNINPEKNTSNTSNDEPQHITDENENSNNNVVVEEQSDVSGQNSQEKSGNDQVYWDDEPEGKSDDNNYENQSEVEEENELENEELPDSHNELDEIPDEIKEKLEDDEEYFDPTDSEVDPLDEKVIKRGYTDGEIKNSQQMAGAQPMDIPNGGAQQIEPEIPEPEIKQPSEVIDEPVGGTGEQKTSTNTTSTSGSAQKTSVNDNLKDMSPSEKRKACQKSADALILMYSEFAPFPFKKMSSFNMRKLEHRHLTGEINWNIQIDDGTSIKDYCENVNNQAEMTFTITEEMKQQIREPLVDVLMENDFALTPTQRLIMAVGSQIAQMGITSFQYMSQNRQALEEFKKITRSMKPNNTSNINNHQQQHFHASPSPEETTSHAENKEERKIYEEEPEQKKSEAKPKVSVDEFLSSNSSDGITIEEIKPE